MVSVGSRAGQGLGFLSRAVHSATAPSEPGGCWCISASHVQHVLSPGPCAADPAARGSELPSDLGPKGQQGGGGSRMVRKVSLDV